MTQVKTKMENALQAYDGSLSLQIDAILSIMTDTSFEEVFAALPDDFRTEFVQWFLVRPISPSTEEAERFSIGRGDFRKTADMARLVGQRIRVYILSEKEIDALRVGIEKVVVRPYIDEAIAILKLLNEDERCEVLNLFCRECLSIQDPGNRCQCWNDE